MPNYKFTDYFENEVLRKRTYLKKEWCARVIESPIRVQVQPDNRVRFWGRIREFNNLVFRVVTWAIALQYITRFPIEVSNNEGELLSRHGLPLHRPFFQAQRRQSRS